MKNNRTKGYVILGIMFVLITIISIAVPSVKNAAFWVSYAFTVIAFAAQIIIWKVAFRSDEALKSKFMGFPIVNIGIIYLVIQIILLIIFQSFQTLPVWAAVIICAAVAGVSAFCMICSSVGRNEIERVSAKVQGKVFFVKQLQVEIEVLANSETDIVIKSALMQLAEKVRFSDPVSDERLTDLEKQIIEKAAELKKGISMMKIINEISLLLDERNRKIKILK